MVRSGHYRLCYRRLAGNLHNRLERKKLQMNEQNVICLLSKRQKPRTELLKEFVKENYSKHEFNRAVPVDLFATVLKVSLGMPND